MFSFLSKAASSLWDFDKAVYGAAILGPGKAAIGAYGMVRDAVNGPGTVNYRGDVLSDDAKDTIKGLPATGAAAMFANWLTGGKPAQIDPGVSLARSAAMAGVEAKAGAGRGMGGLFGLGNILGSAQPSAPMQAGVPYSVPPIPNLFHPGGK